MSVLQQPGGRDAFAELSRFRTAFYGCLSARADAFFELADTLLCADGPTRTPVELSLLAEHQRGYGSLYGALNHGRLDADALRDLLISLPLLRFDGRIVLTVDVSPWLRSDAACSPDRLFCLVHGRNGRSSDHVGLAVLIRRRAHPGPHVLDTSPGRGPAGAHRCPSPPHSEGMDRTPSTRSGCSGGKAPGCKRRSTPWLLWLWNGSAGSSPRGRRSLRDPWASVRTCAITCGRWQCT